MELTSNRYMEITVLLGQPWMIGIHHPVVALDANGYTSSDPMDAMALRRVLSGTKRSSTSPSGAT